VEPAQRLDFARLLEIQDEYRSGGAEMSGFGDPNKTPNGVVVGLAQFQSAVAARPDDLSAHAVRIFGMIGKPSAKASGQNPSPNLAPGGAKC
jgi:hypothetical protein